MIRCRVVMKTLLALSLGALLCGTATRAAPPAAKLSTPFMQKRWLFVWRDMSDPAQVDRTIALFPRAQADGYNAVVFSSNVAPASAF